MMKFVFVLKDAHLGSFSYLVGPSYLSVSACYRRSFRPVTRLFKVYRPSDEQGLSPFPLITPLIAHELYFTRQTEFPHFL